MPRVRAQLKAQGYKVSRKPMAHLMRKARHVVSRRHGFTVTTERNFAPAPGAGLVGLNRRFAADVPNVLWVAAMTYVPTWTRFLYLASGCVQPQGGWLGHGREDDQPTGDLGAEHGASQPKVWKSKAEARTALFTWFKGRYNPRRLHSSLGHLSPINFEEKHCTKTDRAHSTGLPTAAVGSSQAPTAFVVNPASVNA